MRLRGDPRARRALEQSRPRPCRRPTCHLGHVPGRDPHNAGAGLHLLSHQRLGRGEEEHLAGGEPAVEVVHDDGGHEGLTQPGGQTDQRVTQQGGAGHAHLIAAHRVVSGVDPNGPRRRAETRHRARVRRCRARARARVRHRRGRCQEQVIVCRLLLLPARRLPARRPPGLR